MPTLDDFKDLPDRYKAYAAELKSLFVKHGVNSRRALLATYKNDEFKREWKAIWTRIAGTDGGKLSLTSIGLILGAVFGGLGIAAFGGAIGLPWALVLGLAGLVGGTSFDAGGYLTGHRRVTAKVPKEIYQRLVEQAAEMDITPSALATSLIEGGLVEDDE